MKRRFAFTLVELLVVIGIIALLVSILLPALGKARRQAVLTQCQAQLKDIGNTLAMYASANKGSYPGPILGQIRCGYLKGSQTLGTYIAPYLKVAPATDNWQKLNILYCPGYEANNPGIHDDTSLLTYSQQTWDPYPWFGYPDTISFAMRAARGGTCTYVSDTGAKSQQTGPMKVSQVFNAAEMPLLSDIDNAYAVYSTDPSQVATSGDQFMATSKVPNHGGRPEIRQGIFELPPAAPFNSKFRPFYSYVDKTAHTDPPRNFLFADGHVQTIRNSNGILPPQILSKYGPKPSGWFNPVTN